MFQNGNPLYRPSCGNGKVEQGEQCDEKIECCTSDCQFIISDKFDDDCNRYALAEMRKGRNFYTLLYLKLTIQENGNLINLLIHFAVTIYIFYSIVQLRRSDPTSFHF